MNRDGGMALPARSWVAVTVLVLLDLLALYSVVGEWQGALSLGQIVATATQLIYGVCGILGAGAIVMHSLWTRPLLITWAVFATVTAGLAPRVWGGSSLLAAVVSALFGAVVAGAIVILARPSRLNID